MNGTLHFRDFGGAPAFAFDARSPISSRALTKVAFISDDAFQAEATLENLSAQLNVFHNPRALHPLDPSLLPGAAHHHWDGTQFTVHFPEGHLWNSVSGSVRFVSDARRS